MNPEEFLTSIRENDSPPPQVSTELCALWWDARGDWDTAHELCQQSGSGAGDRIHAYLHRKEGDAANALYWYAKASATPPNEPLDDEWSALVAGFLAAEDPDRIRQ